MATTRKVTRIFFSSWGFFFHHKSVTAVLLCKLDNYTSLCCFKMFLDNFRNYSQDKFLNIGYL